MRRRLPLPPPAVPGIVNADVLSADLELRPAGTPPASARRSLQARVTEYLSDLDTSAATLRRLLAEAKASGEPRAEAVIAAKLHEHAKEFLTLVGGQLEPAEPVDLSTYSPRAQALLMEGFALVHEEDEARRARAAEEELW